MLLSGILLINLAILLLIIGGVIYARLKVVRIERIVRDFVSSPDEKTQSPLAQTVDQISQVVARAVIVQAKTTLMGLKSGDVRGEHAVQADIVEGMAGQQLPLAGALLESFPALKKTLKRNPALLDFALSKLSGLTSGGASRSNGGNTSSPKFKL